MQVGTNPDDMMWTDNLRRWRQVQVATIGSDDDDKLTTINDGGDDDDDHSRRRVVVNSGR